MPAIMAKKRRKDAQSQPVPAKKDRHRNPAIGFRPDAKTREILESLAEQEKRAITNMVAVLVEEALRNRGLWPPKEEG